MTARLKQGRGRGLSMLRNNRGFSLPEMIVVTAIFIVVIMVTARGFETVITKVGQQTKLMETDIGSVVGLELLRADLQNAGYGLPWSFQATPTAANYVEVGASGTGLPVGANFFETGKEPKNYDDAPGGVPRAVQSDDTTFNEADDGGGNTVGSKYLVLKSLTVVPGATQRKWVTVSFNESNAKDATTWNAPERDFSTAAGATERVMALRNVFIDGIPSRQLQVQGGGYAVLFNNYTSLTVPHSSGDVFQIYGVDPTTQPRMPFNRADYYVRRPDNPPAACAPGTGVLYKARLGHNGAFSEMPMLDCVADMQVVYGLGAAGSPEINQHDTVQPGTAQEIREQLKEIRVYILAQTGKKDMGYTHPDSTIWVGETFGGTQLGREFDFATHIGSDWRNYRWKLYTVVVRPQNLIQ